MNKNAKGVFINFWSDFGWLYCFDLTYFVNAVITLFIRWFVCIFISVINNKSNKVIRIVHE